MGLTNLLRGPRKGKAHQPVTIHFKVVYHLLTRRTALSAGYTPVYLSNLNCKDLHGFVEVPRRRKRLNNKTDKRFIKFLEFYEVYDHIVPCWIMFLLRVYSVYGIGIRILNYNYNFNSCRVKEYTLYCLDET